MFLALALSLCTLPDPLADLHRFPPREIVRANYDMAWTHYAWLENHQFCHPSHQQAYWTAWQSEQGGAYWAWDLLNDVSAGYYSMEMRIGRLKRLREMIGDEAFRDGRMPLPVQLHRLASIN